MKHEKMILKIKFLEKSLKRPTIHQIASQLDQARKESQQKKIKLKASQHLLQFLD